MTKRLMILGAGPFQVPVIKEARRMGVDTFVVDKNPHAEGIPYADSFLPIDIIDIEACLEAARNYAIDGVLPCGEITLPTASEIANHLGLPGLKPEVAKMAVDKSAVWQRFKEYKVPYPRAKVVHDVKDVMMSVDEIGFPLLFKPAMAFGGSRGVRRVNRREQILESFEAALRASRNSLVLVEEFLDGVEHTVECLIYRSKGYVLAVSDKVRVSDPYCVGISLDYPSSLPEQMQININKIASKAIEAVSLDSGAAHIEMITVNGETKVIDFGARGGAAGFIPAVIVPHVSGVNMIQEQIRMSLGLEPTALTPKFKKGAIFRFFTPPPGKVIGIEGVNEALKIEDVVEIRLNVKVGDIVPVLTTQLQRAGHFVILSDTLEKAQRAAKKVEGLVNIKTREEYENKNN